MGYKLRTARWAYICWVAFDWGERGDPQGEASQPRWEQVSARELYDHNGDDGSSDSGERCVYQQYLGSSRAPLLVFSAAARLY